MNKKSKNKFSDSVGETAMYLDDGEAIYYDSSDAHSPTRGDSPAPCGPPLRIHRKVSLGSELRLSGDLTEHQQLPHTPPTTQKSGSHLASPKRKTTALSMPSSPKLGFGGREKKEKVSSSTGDEEFNLDNIPLSPRSHRKKKSTGVGTPTPSPHSLRRAESDDMDSVKQENRNLQMSLKLKEKEIADLKKRLEKEHKKSEKKNKKKEKSTAILEDIDTEGCLCHSLTFNTEFHIRNMVNPDECSPLDQYLGPKTPKHSPDLSRTDSMESARKQLSSQPWVIDPSEVLVCNEISRGSSAHVLLGIYRNQLVAVKVMKASSNAKMIQDFKQEFQFAHMVKSSYNVYFYGVVFKPALCLVMEFCARKSLHDLMRDKTLKITWRNTLKFLYDFVKAVSILHNWVPPLVHRDIKSMNILITADWELKLCDFGLTRATSMNQMEGTLSKVRGTYTHCAPEVFKGGSWSEMSDMYSVAVVMWEMCYRCVTGTHQVPYAEFSALKFDFQVLMKAAEGLRPTIPDPVPNEMKCLIMQGWDENPQNRICANELLCILNDIMENFEEKCSSWPCMDA